MVKVLGDAAGRPVVIALVGPTATGKTALALGLAGRWPVEIVSADSRMVYRWMDTGTAKPSPAEREAVPHHLVDVVDPDEPYSVALYQQQALAAMARIHRRNRIPLLVGGTGLYVRAVCDGLQIPAVPPDEALRGELEAVAARDGWQELQARLELVDPESARRIEARNVRRVIRALEVYHATGVPFSRWQERRDVPFRTIFIGLDLAHEALYERINRRVEAQVEAGLIDEVRTLLSRGYDSGLTSMSGFGYRELAQYLRGERTREDAVEGYKQATRHFAKRQGTWFHPDRRITWLDAHTATVDDVIRVLEAPSVEFQGSGEPVPGEPALEDRGLSSPGGLAGQPAQHE